MLAKQFHLEDGSRQDVLSLLEQLTIERLQLLVFERPDFDVGRVPTDRRPYRRRLVQQSRTDRVDLCVERVPRNTVGCRAVVEADLEVEAR